jgi:iron complex transport system permease protein
MRQIAWTTASRWGRVLPLPPTRRRRTAVTLAALAGLLVVAATAAAGIGPVPIGATQVVAIVAVAVGLPSPVPFEPEQAAVLLAIRLPRLLLGGLVGAGLAVAGAAMQGLFRNPLAEPSLVGVSSGAALAAVAAIVLGSGPLSAVTSLLGMFSVPIFAFGGALAVTVLVYRLARREGRIMVTTMLLAGIAVNSLAMAGTGLLVFTATDEQLRTITFWSLGSLGGATWTSLGAVAPFLLAGLVGLPTLARPLNALLLGEAEAGHLGVAVDRLTRLIVLLVALSVGAAVAVCGIIGFVGLVVPHVVRLGAGPDHRAVMPASALLGAVLLLLADLLARSVVSPAELPIGIVTALIGAPVFLWLLLRQRSAG